MHRRVLQAVAIGFSWLVFVGLHLYFLQLFLYWEQPWLDILMHIVGGALIVITVDLIATTKLFPRYSASYFGHPVIVLIALASGWEIFRYLIATQLLPNYVADTGLDLVVGLGSGLLTYYFLLSRRMKS